MQQAGKPVDCTDLRGPHKELIDAINRVASLADIIKVQTAIRSAATPEQIRRNIKDILLLIPDVEMKAVEFRQSLDYLVATLDK